MKYVLFFFGLLFIQCTINPNTSTAQDVEDRITALGIELPEVQTPLQTLLNGEKWVMCYT